MTNKINGIDVSECPLYDKKTGCYHTFNGECVKDSCAVYKWLLEYKRLQEENEELKTYIQKMDKPEIKTIDSEIALKNIELQKENEELKEKNTELLNLANNGGALLVTESAKTKKYKQALEEINLIIDELKQQYDYMADYSEIKEIEDKINEVLNDRNKEDIE